MDDTSLPTEETQEPAQPTPPTMEQVLEQWAQIANPKCKKCDGTGVYGWRTVGEERQPIPCMGKRCVIWKYRVYQLMEKRAKLAAEAQAKEEEAKNAETSEEAGTVEN